MNLDPDPVATFGKFAKRYLIIIIIILFAIEIATCQEGIQFRWQAGIGLNFGGENKVSNRDLLGVFFAEELDSFAYTLSSSKRDALLALLDGKRSFGYNRFQPAFGLLVTSPYADATAQVSTGLGSYLALRLEGGLKGYPLAVFQPDLDLGPILVGKLLFIEFGGWLDDSLIKSKPLGTYLGVGAQIAFPLGEGEGRISFARRSISGPNTSGCWTLSGTYSFGGRG